MKSATAMLVGLFLLGLSTTRAADEQTPLIPVGSLSAFPTIVQAGTHPTLTWDIVLPEYVEDVVDIIDPGTIVPERNVVMDVRIIGASVKRVWTNSKGEVVDWEWVPTQGKINYNGEGYEQIFYSTQEYVNPNEIVYSRTVEAGSHIDFGGRYAASNNSWSTFYSSTNSSNNVHALQDGDTPPTTTPLYDQPTIESFILPYLDENGDIELGARDVIILMELTHTDTNHPGFDLQDLAILVTFSDVVVEEDGTTVDGSDTDYVKNNNGHGNNADGVDSSNPGNAPFTDSDPTVDDESSGGGRGRRKK